VAAAAAAHLHHLLHRQTLLLPLQLHLALPELHQHHLLLLLLLQCLSAAPSSALQGSANRLHHRLLLLLVLRLLQTAAAAGYFQTQSHESLRACDYAAAAVTLAGLRVLLLLPLTVLLMWPQVEACLRCYCCAQLLRLLPHAL
jgi:hypothetical protein